MIITYFDCKDDFKVKTRECYAIIPIAGGAEVICKSKDLDPVFIFTEDVIYISEEKTTHCEDCHKKMDDIRSAYDKAMARPQGKWIYPDKEDKEKGYGGYCSVCKCDMPIGMNDWKQEYYESKYCPNCGADMKGGRQ